MELLGQNEVDHRQRKLVILSQDSFYKVLTAEQKAKALKGQYNFDHPGRYRDPEDRVGGPGLDSDGDDLNGPTNCPRELVAEQAVWPSQKGFLCQLPGPLAQGAFRTTAVTTTMVMEKSTPFLAVQDRLHTTVCCGLSFSPVLGRSPSSG